MERSNAQICPDCGSERMSWHLHRTGTRDQRYSQKELHWMCRECGYQRIEGMTAAQNAPTLSPPVSGG